MAYHIYNMLLKADFVTALISVGPKESFVFAVFRKVELDSELICGLDGGQFVTFVFL